jgi:hypothetical protein
MENSAKPHAPRKEKTSLGGLVRKIAGGAAIGTATLSQIIGLGGCMPMQPGYSVCAPQQQRLEFFACSKFKDANGDGYADLNTEFTDKGKTEFRYNEYVTIAGIISGRKGATYSYRIINPRGVVVASESNIITLDSSAIHKTFEPYELKNMGG